MKKIKTLIAAAVLGLGVTVSSISPAAVSMQTAEAATVKQGLVKVKNKYYYYNVENVRYTIAKYKHTGFIRNRIVYGFSYEVYGKTYNTNTEQILSNYNLEEDRLLIKYSAKQYGAGEVVKVVVPKWVLSPPKDGWKQFPPDINWKGAELDTAYMKSMNLEIP